MPCLEEASKTRQVCDEERDEGYDTCSDWGEKRSRECTGWAALVCLFFVWIVESVCLAWTWVSNIVCVAWSYIVEVVCLVYVAIRVAIETIFFGPRYRIDVHCHFMTARSISVYFVVGLIECLTDLDLVLRGNRPRRSRDLLVPEEQIDVANKVAAVANCVRIFMLRNSTQVYRELRRTYLWQYKVCPLLLDFSHFSNGTLTALLRMLDDTMTRLHTTLASVAPPNVLELQATLSNAVGEMRSQLLMPLPAWDYPSLTSELSAVRRRYPHNVFPFLGVDPRRPGILEIVKQSVSRKGPFYGVKLYTPVGFSPTDPVLFGGPDNKDCVYRFCEEEQLPITVHCSPGGFSSLEEAFAVQGLVHFGEGVQVAVQGFKGSMEDHNLAEVIGTLVFSTTLPDLNAVIAERSRALNHPQIWKRVLMKYPNLYLNLAHFGGQEEATRYADERDEVEHTGPWPTWTEQIEHILWDYKNVYVDLSAYANGPHLRTFRTRVYDRLKPELKERVMYGSDFNILMLFEVSVADYLADFRDTFPAEFDALSFDNPRRFLFQR